MAAPVTIKEWGKGLNLDQPPFELAPGFWSLGQNVRFRTGKAERVGGVASVITPSIVPYFMIPYSSGTLDYVFYMGLTKAYVHNGTSATEITRVSFPTIRTVTAATCRRYGTSVFITYTLSGNHNLAAGDIFTSINFDSGYNRTNATVYGDTSVVPGFASNYNTNEVTLLYFTDSATDPPAAGTSVALGSYSLVSVAGTSTQNFAGAIDDKLTGGNFNGVVFVNSPVDGLYYWDQSISGVLRLFPDTQYVATFARSFKNFIFQGGKTKNGVKYPHRLEWSASADPGSIPVNWTPLATNDAGGVDLVSDGEMVDAYQWGEDYIVYKRDVRFRGSYIGGNLVFDEKRIPGHGDDGMLAQNCAASAPGVGQVFLTDGLDIRIHQGGESKSIAEGRVLEYLRTNINQTYRTRSFLTTNPYRTEIWICYPETGQSTCTKALTWNWEEDSWGTRDLSGVTFGCAGELPTTIANGARLLLANNTPKIGLVDSGTTYFGASQTSRLERTGMTFDSASYKTLQESMPLFHSSTTGWTANVYHGSSQTQDGTVTWTAAQVYTHGTTRRVSAIANSGPYLGWKMDTAAADTPALHTNQFWITEDGEY